jgi:hypothetical protein
MTAMRGDSAWAPAARLLFLVAMAIFLVTISIGIPNALDVVTFDHNQILTHVHSGTIGWLTLSIVASRSWRSGRERLAPTGHAVPSTWPPLPAASRRAITAPRCSSRRRLVVWVRRRTEATLRARPAADVTFATA